VLETIPVRADEQFAIEPVAKLLEIDPRALQVEQFPAGQSNLTYLLHTDDWEAVLRRPPLGPLAPRAHDMLREAGILARLHPVYSLAPRPLLVCEDAALIGAPFYVMERRHGVVLDQELPDGWPASRQLHAAITQSLVRGLVDLHAVDWRAAGLDAIGRPDGYLRRQVAGWLDRFARVRTFEAFEVEPLTRWLEDNLPQSPPATVIHNDYKLNNVLLDAGEPRRLSAVLDWEMATLGDPISDLASLLVYWTEPGEEEMLGGLKSVTADLTFPRREQVAELYARLSGRDLGDIDWYVAFAYFKVAVICQQIFYRWNVGQTRDDRFASHEGVARRLLARAAEVAGQI
jgi:aminoglycoside phosphotransferase (APT) family kinase protein